MKRALLVVFGVCLSMAGIVGALLSVVALADPAGMQMAEDANAFGPPPTKMTSALMLVGFLTIASAGVWLWRKSARNDSAPTLGMEAIGSGTRGPYVKCSFCSAGRARARNLIAGAGGHICDECVILCIDILVDQGGYSRLMWRAAL